MMAAIVVPLIWPFTEQRRPEILEQNSHPNKSKSSRIIIKQPS